MGWVELVVRDDVVRRAVDRLAVVLRRPVVRLVPVARVVPVPRVAPAARCVRCAAGLRVVVFAVVDGVDWSELLVVAIACLAPLKVVVDFSSGRVRSSNTRL
jgi:hypothetical protein